MAPESDVEIQTVEIDRDETVLGTVSLHRYAAETGEVGYEVRLNGEFLMATHGACGEVTMAELAWQRLARPTVDLTVLVAGLGAGHTLHAALQLSGVVAVEVVELSAKVVDWNRRYFSATNHGAVDDPRVRVKVADVATRVLAATEAFDIVLQDVDNGPGWLASRANAPAYEREGLQAFRRCLRAGGVLAVWSPQANDLLHGALRDVFGAVDEVRTTGPTDAAPGLTDVIYLAVRH